MKLHNYQLNNIERIKKVKKLALFLDMGLGKTITTLKAIDELFKENKAKKVLVIAPLKVCNLVWEQEVNKWSSLLNNINIGVATGYNCNKILGDDKYNVVVINRDIVIKVSENHNLKQFDTLVIDESTSFKNHRSKRFMRLRKYKHFNYVILLSGIPSPNHLLDIWSQIYLLDYGKSLGNYTNFTKKFFYEEDSLLIPRKNATKEITKCIRHMCFSMKAKDYLELPKLLYNNIKLELTIPQQRQYKIYAKEFVLLNELNDDEVLTKVNNKLVLLSKLIQYTSGFNYDSKTGQTIIIHEHKIKALLDILNDNSNTRFIIVYNFTAERELLLSKLLSCKANSRTGKEAEEWLNNKFRILLIHPKSSGFGLNLQKGGNNIIWYSLTWSLEEYLQTNARVYRQGQTKPCVITHITINNTIEQRITKALVNKMKSANTMINELKV